MNIRNIPTQPFDDQKPGTAGLRKKVRTVTQAHYLENFFQSVFDTAALPEGACLVAGGDGRYYNREALQLLIRMSAANGVGRLIIGRDGLLSTPAASHLIRKRSAQGGFILTASHNPGGPENDFGIKFNIAGGGQAPAAFTDEIYRRSREISHYRIADVAAVDLGQPGEQQCGDLLVEVVDPVSDYSELMQELFDFNRLRELLGGGKFRMRFDAMHAITGPYAQKIFEHELGAPAGSVVNAIPLPDFGGGHPDPNPVDASALVAYMQTPDAPDLAAASDGDGDRNMILGPGLVVSPGDSLAVLAARAHSIPAYAAGLVGVARSMPTSRAVDRVARKLNIPCYETPTGWRYFCNLLESNHITLCGEESFGTGSNHVREKDGLWAVLCWMSLVAESGQSVTQLVQAHWRSYGRDFFSRHDYFIADTDQAERLLDNLRAHLSGFSGQTVAGLSVADADQFHYEDPVDGSRAENQGIRVFMSDGSRIVYRLSGTGTSGATLRVYLDSHTFDSERYGRKRDEVLADLASASRHLAEIQRFTGLQAPTATV